MSSEQNQLEQERFRGWVRRLWTELARLDRPREFVNIEGGSVEQIRDRRLQLHHCANYAAVLTILELNSADAKLSLLELGCGSGGLSCALARVMPEGWQLKATDYSERLLATARRFYQEDNLRFEFLDVRRLEPERFARVDGVFLLEVIEHLRQEEASELLHRLHRALGPRARLIITTLDRSPFPRPFSGYPPHHVEYSFRTMHQFLSDRNKNPFAEFEIYRLARIAAEEVAAEERGGYLVNRLQRLVTQVTGWFPVVARLRQRVLAAGFRVYALLPQNQRFDFDGYLATMSLVRPEEAAADRYDRESFGLVVVLRKG